MKIVSAHEFIHLNLLKTRDQTRERKPLVVFGGAEYICFLYLFPELS